MQEKDKTKLIATIQRLLNLAEDMSNPHESALAKERAAEMLAKYNIDMVEIGEQSEDNLMTETMIKGFSTTPIVWERALAIDVSNVFQVKYIKRPWYKTRTGESNRNGWSVVFIGHKADVVLAEFFYIIIRRNIFTMAEVYKNELKAQGVKERGGGHFYIPLSDRVKGYQLGLQKGACARLVSLHKRAEEIIPTDTMALVNMRKDAVLKYVDKMYPNLRHTTVNTGLSGVADEMHGYNHAGRINLGRPVNGGNGAPSELGQEKKALG